jgi:ABC-type branched-subunit amino acid transport system ATPase component
VQKVAFDIGREIVSLIGPNRPTDHDFQSPVRRLLAGRRQIRLDGEDLAGRRPYEICQRGIGRTRSCSRC